MKKNKIIYWVSTVLFGGFMAFSAYPDIVSTPDTVEFFKLIDMPTYLLPFLGIAKVLGVIALFIPGFPRVTEWAYAGLFFDLIGALYSTTAATGGDITGFVFFGVLISVGIVSYIYYHKLLKAKLVVS